MSDTSLSARLAEGDFRIGRVLNRTSSVLSRNFVIFFVVTTIANLPGALVLKIAADPASAGSSRGTILLGSFLTMVLSAVSQAVVVYGAFQDMRGRPASVTDSLKIGLYRFLPVIGLAILMSLGTAFGALLLIIPGVILFVMWYVAMPACVVERLGPFDSMARSSELTKGHRWKIFGLVLLLCLGVVVSEVLDEALSTMASAALTLIGTLLWNGVRGAFYAIAAVVTYHDLRVAKEGINIEQIAAVFD